ncbi:Polyribonucleotide nucleotidyltransferase [hydrothermal vent metagenome]|uniref:polyribonucleotide nucleotidyltransferase n=1 Tax=hydrothermal vent metagenome TaxID=652676 RepID=A0A3B1C585_9ZZZZ
MQAERVELDINGKTFFIESGVLAKQAAGSVVVGFEETIILAAVAAEEKAREGLDFFPLTVDYRDRTSAAGRIPGGFLKREARPSDRETLTSRIVDRSIRPMFEKGFLNETQVIINPLSFDYEHETSPLALTGASAALSVSYLPFHQPVSAVRVGRVDGEFIVNPTIQQIAESDINILCAGTEDSLNMVEGSGKEMSEDDLVAALEFAHGWIKQICVIQTELKQKLGKKKIEVPEGPDRSAEIAAISEKMGSRLRDAILTSGKKERGDAIKEVRNAIIAEIIGDEPEDGVEAIYKEAFDTVRKGLIREMILSDGLRADSRKTDEIRQIDIGVDALPRTHGSTVFTRGETQALVTTTLGTGQDELMEDFLEGRQPRRFMLHYNFPAFCVGEVKRMMGPGRREIGHGTLAQNAIEPVLPTAEDFPYTIRIVSEILESNGSSSMASVCGASLSLMDAGVPISGAVAGIAMGLVQDGDRSAILSDILGLEDAVGDMDFKVAGTRKGITAVQMDIKVKGLPVELMQRALEQAKQGRFHILDKMAEALAEPRSELNKNAPRIHTLQINPDKIRDIIGPGGKVIRGITADTGCQIDVNDEGIVKIASTNGEQLKAALDIINAITQEAVIGKIYVGSVKKIVDFGAFVEIFPGTEGLCHISEMAPHRIERMEDEADVGDEMLVKVIDIDRSGKIRLSRKEAMSGGGDDAGGDSGSRRPPRRPEGGRDGGRGGNDRGPRGGGRGDRGGRR